MKKPLAIVPTYVRNEDDERITALCLQTMLATTADDDLDIMVVDDASPRRDLVSDLELKGSQFGVEFQYNQKNKGFASTVNVGLDQALQEGRDAILVNADIEFFDTNWLKALQERDAYVVGSKLFFPQGYIQHAGIYFSVLNRLFDHRYRMGPMNLPEANRPTRCPVTGALMYIRHESLALVGTFDEKFKHGYEDIDYCIRVFDIGRECWYEPRSMAIHHESLFHTSSHNEKIMASFNHLHTKHAGKSFADYMPTMMEEENG